MSDTRILLLCSNRFALPALLELAYFNQIAALVIPEHCDEWYENVMAALTGVTLPVILVKKETYVSQLQEAFAVYKANIGLMITFSFKIPASVFTIPEKGFYNIHPGLLPAYRGPDPVFFQIKNREKYTGVTVHQLDEHFDKGPVVVQERIKVLADDTYGMLSERLSHTAAKLTGILIKLLDFNLPLPLKQQDENRASYFKKQVAADVNIKWETMNAAAVVALINACNPWNKGATTRWRNVIVRLLEARVLTEPLQQTGLMPGSIYAFHDAGMLITCAEDTAIEVRIVYSDAGFMNAGRLPELGITAGHSFESL